MHTGQHYDVRMSDVFFDELSIPAPGHQPRGRLGESWRQTGEIIAALDPIVRDDGADGMLVYGDTNSTLAGALVAAKLTSPSRTSRPGCARFDRRMPEEVNRVVTDHLSRWLFAPTPTAVANLAAEGIVDGVTQVGDVMEDLAARTVPGIRDAATLSGL